MMPRVSVLVLPHGIDLELPAGRTVGVIGPDGVGKSSLLALVAGARRLQHGALDVLDVLDVLEVDEVVELLDVLELLDDDVPLDVLDVLDEDEVVEPLELLAERGVLRLERLDLGAEVDGNVVLRLGAALEPVDEGAVGHWGWRGCAGAQCAFDIESIVHRAPPCRASVVSCSISRRRAASARCRVTASIAFEQSSSAAASSADRPRLV